MFPPGPPGLALLLLRASVSIALLADSYGHRQELPGWALAASILVSAALVLGCLTPLAAMSALAFHVLVWLAFGASSVAAAAIVCLDVIVLALLGPGAYSVDSRRYGPREVILPPP